jgi:zinc protease
MINKIMMKESFPQYLTVVLVLTLFAFLPLRSWAVQSTTTQEPRGKTSTFENPEPKQEVAKSPALKTAIEKFSPPGTIIYPLLQYQIPRAERIVLDNGIILFLLEDHELPLVRISAVVRTGTAYDPSDKAGLAELACRAMRTGGTATLTGDEIDDQLDRYAINIWTSADTEMSRLGLSTLKENLATGVDLFSQILQSPRFDPAKVQTEKDLLKEGLRRIEDDPQDYAFREFRKHLYRGNPRGNQKTLASVDKLQVSDLTGFHRKYFYPGNMMISVTGDITREEVLQLFSRYFAPSTTKEKSESLPAPIIRGDGKVILIPKDTPQSIVLMGFPAPPKNSPEYFAFSILDFVLGSGGFRSRIFQEIRNNQGLAYSAGSVYKAREDYGVLSIYGMTKADSTMKVLDTMKTIVREAGNTPLKSEEIDWAKKSMTNNFLFSFVSAEQIAYQQMIIEYEGLPSDFLQLYRDNIQKVKPGDIQSLANKYLRAEQATVLILGDEKRFDHPVNASGLVTPGN